MTIVLLLIVWLFIFFPLGIISLALLKSFDEGCSVGEVRISNGAALLQLFIAPATFLVAVIVLICTVLTLLFILIENILIENHFTFNTKVW